MYTSVIGFPRIGTLRELKFTLEKYFRQEIEAEELLRTAQELRKTHWNTQKEAGIDYIPGNDFSFYDITLDTAALLGIIPKRYQELNLSELDTYFAMARGYQESSGDVKALAMKKWFNTNYHYIVPEVEDDTVISLTGDKLWKEYEEALALGIETKPIVTGARLATGDCGRLRGDGSSAARRAEGVLLSALCTAPEPAVAPPRSRDAAPCGQRPGRRPARTVRATRAGTHGPARRSGAGRVSGDPAAEDRGGGFAGPGSRGGARDSRSGGRKSRIQRRYDSLRCRSSMI